MATKICALNPGIGEDIFPLYMTILGKTYIVKSSLVKFISDSQYALQVFVIMRWERLYEMDANHCNRKGEKMYSWTPAEET